MYLFVTSMLFPMTMIGTVLVEVSSLAPGTVGMHPASSVCLHKGGPAVAKLDRAYATWHASCQVDSSIESSALPSVQALSDHRPISMANA